MAIVIIFHTLLLVSLVAFVLNKLFQLPYTALQRITIWGDLKKEPSNCLVGIPPNSKLKKPTSWTKIPDLFKLQEETWLCWIQIGNPSIPNL